MDTIDPEQPSSGAGARALWVKATRERAAAPAASAEGHAASGGSSTGSTAANVRVSATQKRINTRKANEFFERDRSAVERRNLLSEASVVDPDTEATVRREARREMQLTYKRRYREVHGEEIARYKREWRERHPEAVQKDREAAQLRARRGRRPRPLSPARKASIARWREAHPERERVYSRRYYRNHRDDRLASAQRWREEHPEEHARSMQHWQQNNRDHLAEYQRQYRQDHPEVYERAKEAARERKRLIAHLKQMGLPPIARTRVRVAQKRVNEREATKFFETVRLSEHRKKMLREAKPIDPEQLARWNTPLARRYQSLFRMKLQLQSTGAESLYRDTAMDSRAREISTGRGFDVDAAVRQRAFSAAGGQDYLDHGGDRHTAAMLVEDIIGSRVPAALRPDGSGMLWVPEHTRSGQLVAGHWRRRPGS